MTITIVNFLSTIIFVKMSKYEMEINTGLENLSVFKYIFVQATVNTGLVLVFSEKNTYTDNWFLTMGP
jgi:hypothetical protein